MIDSLLNNILVFSVVGSGLGLALWTYLGDRKNAVNKFFFYLVLIIVLNILSSYFLQETSDVKIAFIWARMIWLTASFSIPIFYFFGVNFPKKVKGYLIMDILWIALGIIFSGLSIFSRLLIKNIALQSWGNEIEYGPLINLFYGAFVGAIIAGFWMIFKKYVELNNEEKLKIKYFIFGIAMFVVATVIFGIILPYVFNISEYTSLGDYSAIIFLAFTAYAIMKHQLFNIKIIATESIVILLSFGLFVEILMSNSISETVIKSIIWVLATYGGYQLVKSVKHEIEQKEKIEKLAKELEKANDHLKEVDKLKDDFLSMASHELNTPIAAIKGYLSMILVEGLGGKIPDKARGYLESVYTSSERLANMVKDLLNVSRIESNRIHIIWEQKPIEDIINQAITEVMSKAKEAGHTMTFEAQKQKMPLTWYDQTRITEVLINMLGNAIKYTPNGGKITVRVVNDDDKIVVSVEDNGKGIPKDRQHAVFEKFTQVDVLKDEVKGTGLGMYISQKFIQLHKGKIWFHSDGEGKGTTFFFSLPIIKEKPFDPHEGQEAVLH